MNGSFRTTAVATYGVLMLALGRWTAYQNTNKAEAAWVFAVMLTMAFLVLLSFMSDEWS